MKRLISMVVAALAFLALLSLSALAMAVPGRAEAPSVGRIVDLKPAEAGPANPRLPIVDFMLDDGGMEYQFGLNTQGHGLVLLGLNRFTLNPGEYPLLLTQISVLFPDQAHANIDLTGRNVDLLVYRDTSGSGQPTNASKIYQATVQVQTLSPNFSVYPVSIPIQGPGDIYIGFSNTYDHGGGVIYSYPYGLDQGQSQRRSWIIGNFNGSDPNYNDLGNNQLVTLTDDFGMAYIGNFLIRGQGEVGATPAPTSTRTRTPTPGPSVTRPPAYTLYDQYDHISTIYASNSQQYEPYMQAYTDYLADDFDVPAGQTWYLDEVDVAGRIDAGMGPVDSFNVTVYSSGGTVPGNPVFTATNVPYTLQGGSDYHISLQAPAVLGTGTYWLMVQGNLAYQTAGQFMWYNRGAQSYNQAAWYNPGGAWGTNCSEQWGTRWMCNGDASEPDQVYRLLGTASGGQTPPPTNTATNTPTAPAATNTPTRTNTPPVPTNTPTKTNTVPAPTNTPTMTGSPPVATNTPIATSTIAVVTNTPTDTVTRQPTNTATATPSGTPATATPTVTPCPMNFSDVHPSDYFYTPVQYLFCEGAISGYADGTFRPFNNTTRGQLSKIVVNAEHWPIVSTGGPHFVDVPPDSPFYGYVETAYNRGIISGYTCGGVGEPCPGLYFRPNNNVTRAQLSKIVVSAQGWTIDTAGGPHFVDVPPTDTFYGYIETAYNHGIISGYADNTFRPGANATRGQISKIVYGAVTAPGVRG